MELVADLAAQLLVTIGRELTAGSGRFEEQYRRLDEDLTNLRPILDGLPAQFNGDALVCQLRAGIELIEKCRRVSRLKFLTQMKYSRRLRKLDEEINRFVRVHTVRRHLEELATRNRRRGIRRSIYLGVFLQTCLEPAKEMALVEVAAGVVLQQLWEIVRVLATQPGRFREQYRRLEQDLASLKPILARLPPAELNDVLRRGGELIEKCDKVSRWNFFKQKKYSRRLKKLDEEIDRFVRMQTLREIQEVRSRMSEAGGIRRFFGCFACSSPSDPAARDRGEHS
ncbi:hypothetical protein EJ110_NYTH35970 [Nymphaea thermarum]|nr:hypothetical protein EJ110_NYTH35970 [Nymphaea thermarum]